MNVSTLISQGNLKKAINLALELTESDKDKYNNVLGLSGRYHRNEKAKLNGTINYENYKLEYNL